MMWILIIIGIIIVIFIIVALVFYKPFMGFFGRKDIDPDFSKAPDNFKGYIKQYQESLPWLNRQDKEDLYIKSRDHLKLKGELFKLNPGTKKVVLAMHGYHGGGQYDMSRFVRFYKDNGYDCLVISQRTHESSEGKYIGFGYLEQFDGILWCKKLIELYGEDVRIVLHGVSMGGATVDLMSGNPELPSQVKMVISDCAYDSMLNEVQVILKDMPGFARKVSVFFLSFWCQLLAHYNISKASPIEAVKKSKIPTIFIHGGNDDFVPTVMVNELYSNCNAPKWLFIVPGAGHAASYVKQPDEYEKVVKDFWTKY